MYYIHSGASNTSIKFQNICVTPKENFVPIRQLLPTPRFLQPLATISLHSFSVDLSALDI